jgi:hypothetical protein
VHAGSPGPAEDTEWVKALPKEVGVLLLVVGIGGLLLPGPVGSPFFILGGVVLWPRVFARLEVGFARRFPNVHRAGVHQIKRYLSDLERRYPSQV